jgi:hypothetical protein
MRLTRHECRSAVIALMHSMQEVKGDISMLNLRYAALFALALIMSSYVVGIKTAHADVYVCSNSDCDEWTAITDDEYDKTPGLSAAVTCDKDVTIKTALDGTKEVRINNAVSGNGSWNIYLKSSLWHKGGSDILSCDTHLTGYLYKDDEHKTTCHIFAIYNADRKYWPATCN